MNIAKLPIERVSEVDMGVTTVHYGNPGAIAIDAVTLCNVTRWESGRMPKKTTRAVTCAHCSALANILTSAAQRAAQAAQGGE